MKSTTENTAKDKPLVKIRIPHGIFEQATARAQITGLRLDSYVFDLIKKDTCEDIPARYRHIEIAADKMADAASKAATMIEMTQAFLDFRGSRGDFAHERASDFNYGLQEIAGPICRELLECRNALQIAVAKSYRPAVAT